MPVETLKPCLIRWNRQTGRLNSVIRYSMNVEALRSAYKAAKPHEWAEASDLVEMTAEGYEWLRRKSQRGF